MILSEMSEATVTILRRCLKIWLFGCSSLSLTLTLVMNIIPSLNCARLNRASPLKPSVVSPSAPSE